MPMKRVVLVAALVIAAIIAPSTAGPEKERVRGVVIDAHGQPVAGARVELRVAHGGCARSPGKYITARTETDKKGRFALPKPPAGMEFYVSHDSHAPAWESATDDARIEMPRAAYLELVVPERARIAVAHGMWHFALREAQGIVRVGPLPAGVRLDLTVDAPNRTRFAQTILLLPGQTRKVRAEGNEGTTLSGRVDPPLAGVRIEAFQRGGNRTLALSDDTGSFTLRGLEEGDARLVAIAPNRDALVVDTKTDEFIELRWNR